MISIPGEALVILDEEFEAVVEASHAVIDEADAAGVYVCGGGIDADVDPVLEACDGTGGTYPGHKGA